MADKESEVWAHKSSDGGKTPKGTIIKARTKASLRRGLKSYQPK